MPQDHIRPIESVGGDVSPIERVQRHRKDQEHMEDEERRQRQQQRIAEAAAERKAAREPALRPPRGHYEDDDGEHVDFLA